MADEKWIPLQSHDKEGNKQKQMVKAAALSEDIRLFYFSTLFSDETNI